MLALIVALLTVVPDGNIAVALKLALLAGSSSVGVRPPPPGRFWKIRAARTATALARILA